MLFRSLPQDKLYGLGLAGFPAGHAFPSPERRFPIKGQPATLPQTEPDYHLVHTLIPRGLGQPRSFPQQQSDFFSLFCNRGFNPDRSLPYGLQKEAGCDIHRYHSRQATLHAAFTTYRFTPQAVVLKPDQGLSPHTWVSAEAGSGSTCHCGPPHPP